MTLVLPATTRYEMEGGCTTTSTERRIRFSPEIPGPRIEGARPEWTALCELANQVLGDADPLFAYGGTQDIRDEMERTMPLYKGIAGLREEGDWIQWGGEQLFEGGEFPEMPGGRARLLVQDIHSTEIPDGWFHLTTRRGKQFNSMVFSGNGGPDRASVFINAEDAREFGLGDGDPVLVTSETGGMRARVKIAPVRRRTVQAFWPEANVLIPRRYDPVSKEPDYSVFVKVRRA